MIGTYGKCCRRRMVICRLCNACRHETRNFLTSQSTRFTANLPPFDGTLRSIEYWLHLVSDDDAKISLWAYVSPLLSPSLYFCATHSSTRWYVSCATEYSEKVSSAVFIKAVSSIAPAFEIQARSMSLCEAATD